MSIERNSAMRIKNQLAMFLLSGMAATTALAQDAAALHARGLAATCANCHGTEGRTTEGSGIPSLAGMPREYMLMQIKAFKDGSRPATVMHQLSKGFTDQQIESVATYFAALKR
jgi:cytochrome subunit of sulfide dehydrogenase